MKPIIIAVLISLIAFSTSIKKNTFETLNKESSNTEMSAVTYLKAYTEITGRNGAKIKIHTQKTDEKQGYFFSWDPVYYSSYAYSWDYYYTGYDLWYYPSYNYYNSFYPFYSSYWDYWYPYNYLSDYYWGDSYFGDYYWRKEGKNKSESKISAKVKETNISNDGKLKIAEPKDAKFGDIHEELKQLKKEVFGDENKSTEKIRADAKAAYSNEWLLKQLKLTKLIDLDNRIKDAKEKKEEKKEEKVEKKVEKKETPKKEEKKEDKKKF